LGSDELGILRAARLSMLLTLRTRSRIESSVEEASRLIAMNAAIRMVSWAEDQRLRHI
jgi:hypothetical protein